MLQGCGSIQERNLQITVIRASEATEQEEKTSFQVRFLLNIRLPCYLEERVELGKRLTGEGWEVF